MNFALDDWFAIFRAGTHTDSAHKTATFTEADLDSIVERYNADSPAPCVINHEELYSPFAYAQIGEVRHQDGVLQARCKADSIEPQFAKLVADGRLYNRSVQLLPARDQRGGWRLGHVAFLGAEPPAVDGLAPIKMSAAGRCFSAEDAWDKVTDARNWARVMRILKVFGDKIFGPDSDANPVSDWEVSEADEAVGAAREKAKQQTQPEDKSMKYTQQQVDAQVQAAADKAAADAKAAADQAHEKARAEFAAERKAARAAAIKTRIDALVSAGQVLPADAPQLSAFAAAQPEAAFEFSRPDSDAVEQTEPLEFLFSLLEKQPAKIQLGKQTGAADPAGGALDTSSAPAINAAALKYQKAQAEQGVTVSLAGAVHAVVAQAAAA